MEFDWVTALRIPELVAALEKSGNAAWGSALPAELEALLSRLNNGNLPHWLAAYHSLPEAAETATSPPRLDQAHIRVSGRLPDADTDKLKRALQALHPWRKGPFDLFGVHIDSEWRSDRKWARVQPYLSPLAGRRVLDIGCGNGYYAWRMAGEGARLVLGVDPNWLFMCQFLAVQRYVGTTPPVFLLPLTSQQLPVPGAGEGFDTVFSMGVLYHRRDHLAHLAELKRCLLPGGELVLETLVIEGDAGAILVPDERYARMRNVWALPSVSSLIEWLEQAGFARVQLVDESVTTTDEQRQTEWMQFESLAQCLDPNQPTRTVEGYPAPRRAVMIAQAP